MIKINYIKTNKPFCNSYWTTSRLLEFNFYYNGTFIYDSEATNNVIYYRINDFVEYSLFKIEFVIPASEENINKNEYIRTMNDKR